MRYIDLDQAHSEILNIQKRRSEIHYTGAEDLNLLARKHKVYRDVVEELKMIRVQIEVAPLSMLSELKSRENEILEWLHSN